MRDVRSVKVWRRSNEIVLLLALFTIVARILVQRSDASRAGIFIEIPRHGLPVIDIAASSLYLLALFSIGVEIIAREKLAPTLGHVSPLQRTGAWAVVFGTGIQLILQTLGLFGKGDDVAWHTLVGALGVTFVGLVLLYVMPNLKP